MNPQDEGDEENAPYNEIFSKEMDTNSFAFRVDPDLVNIISGTAITTTSAFLNKPDFEFQVKSRKDVSDIVDAALETNVDMYWWLSNKKFREKYGSPSNVPEDVVEQITTRLDDYARVVALDTMRKVFEVISNSTSDVQVITAMTQALDWVSDVRNIEAEKISKKRKT